MGKYIKETKTAKNPKEIKKNLKYHRMWKKKIFY